MSNPVLNEQALQKASRAEAEAGWAAPQADTALQADAVWNPPITDGPITPYRTKTMTVSGAVSATGVLFVLLLITGVIGWNLVSENPDGTVDFPGWVLLPVFVGFGLAILAAFKPHLSRILAPFYALAQGLFLGAISHAYNARWDGIVLQAIGATAGVFLVMLALYGLRILRVTERFRRIVIGATVGVALFYLVSLVFSLFGATPSFLYDASAFGIILSLVVAGIAALNLALDFDLIEKGTQMGAPKYMEWYCALGLMVTIVWLYLELLRLLSRLRQ